MFEFEKVQGLGNDFVVLDRRAGGGAPSPEEARWWCDRRRGVGADGVLTLLVPRGTEAELALVIHNADGSVPEMCGNGLRCVVAVVRGGAPRVPLLVETGAGLRSGFLQADGQVTVTLGRGEVLGPVEVELGGRSVVGTAASLGNPHLVLFLPEGLDPEAAAAAEGARLERHPAFPDRVNVGFAAVDSDGISLVVHERGAGRTEACGTGAAAAALVARASGRWTAPGPVPVRLPGGQLSLMVPVEGTGEIQLTGPAVRVFKGAARFNGYSSATPW